MVSISVRRFLGGGGRPNARFPSPEGTPLGAIERIARPDHRLLGAYGKNRLKTTHGNFVAGSALAGELSLLVERELSPPEQGSRDDRRGRSIPYRAQQFEVQG